VAGLDELAKLLVSAGEGLRVVGYSDESGSRSQTAPFRARRADKVIRCSWNAASRAEKLALVPRSTLAPIGGFKFSELVEAPRRLRTALRPRVRYPMISAKVMLLGDIGVGKTSLARPLRLQQI